VPWPSCPRRRISTARFPLPRNCWFQLDTHVDACADRGCRVGSASRNGPRALVLYRLLMTFAGVGVLGLAGVVTRDVSRVAVVAAGHSGLADRYHDTAARLAWEFAAVQSAVSEGAWDSSAITDVTVERPRRGISSVPTHPRFMGEAAFA
jgi:hypothetical protein